MVDPEGNDVLFSYDEWGRSLHVLAPSPVSETTQADASAFFSGNLSAFDDNDPSTGFAITSTSYEATDYGWEVTATDPLGRETTVGSNFQGNVRFVKQPQISDDELYGRPTSWYDYDNDGILRQTRDPNGNETTYTYNGLNLLESVTYPEVFDTESQSVQSPVELYQYDMIGRMTDRTDPRGLVYSYQYNHLNQLTHSSYPCLLYTSPSPRDATLSRMPSSA